jgi:Fe-S-cluster containining protein
MSDDAELDCLSCGACCRDAATSRVLVSAEDIVRWRREGRDDIVDGLVPGHFSQEAFPVKPDGSCIHLGIAATDGSEAMPNHCSIYATRAEPCRIVEPGSDECLHYRRRAGKG